MKVSIITATDRQLSERAIKSVENQSDKNFEWVVVSDGYESNPMPLFFEDGTPNRMYNKIKLVSIRNNYGPSVARNIGFQISDGDIITYLDSDDELSPNRVKEVIEMFTGFDTKISFSGYNIVQDGQTVEFNPVKYKHMMGATSDYDYVYNTLKTQNISIPMGVAHTRDVFAIEGGFQRGIVCGEDGILWRRIVDNLYSNMVFLSKTNAGTYHVNPDGQSRKQPRFEMGGFAFDGSKRDNGKYLDREWYATFNSVNLFDKE